MTADAFEVRPPAVEALRWTPGNIDSVGRFLTWAQFSGADPQFDGVRGITAETILIVRCEPAARRCYLRPGEWLVLDGRYGGRFVIRSDQQFHHEYRRQQP